VSVKEESRISILDSIVHITNPAIDYRLTSISITICEEEVRDKPIWIFDDRCAGDQPVTGNSFISGLSGRIYI
jgi:hypothetical protein